jgi:hypothetical protein
MEIGQEGKGIKDTLCRIQPENPKTLQLLYLLCLPFSGDSSSSKSQIVSASVVSLATNPMQACE